MYPAEIVIPMKGELTENGFADLVTASGRAGDQTARNNIDSN